MIAINSGSWYQHLIRQYPAIPASLINRFEVYNTLIEAHPIVLDVYNIQNPYPNLILQVINLSDIILNTVLGLMVENISIIIDSPVFNLDGDIQLSPPEILIVEHL
jgi:hypothetical protein